MVFGYDLSQAMRQKRLENQSTSRCFWPRDPVTREALIERFTYRRSCYFNSTFTVSRVPSSFKSITTTSTHSFLVGAAPGVQFGWYCDGAIMERSFWNAELFVSKNSYDTMCFLICSTFYKDSAMRHRCTVLSSTSLLHNVLSLRCLRAFWWP